MFKYKIFTLFKNFKDIIIIIFYINFINNNNLRIKIFEFKII